MSVPAQYCLAYITPECPKCGDLNGYILNRDTCQKCGTGRPSKDTSMPLTPEILQPEIASSMIEYTCTQCGEVFYKQRKARRTLCKICDTKRINANRKRGIVIAKALKYYICKKCGRTIHKGTQHYVNTSSDKMAGRWHLQCHERQK